MTELVQELRSTTIANITSMTQRGLVLLCEILKTEKRSSRIQSGKLFWNQNQIRFLLVEKLAIMCSLTL
jgi:hypothetical protein